MEYILHPECIALKSSTGFTYQYNLTDHLGNVRSVVAGTTATQNTDYYPFGLAHVTDNLDKNNGKELQNENIAGKVFNNLDYGARFYDPTIARWNVIDPLADHPKQVGVSPYAYATNNPIRYVDPDGMIWDNPKQFEKLNRAVNNRIESIENSNTKIKSKIDKGGLSDKRITRLGNRDVENRDKVKLLNQSLADIEAIRVAPEKYKLSKQISIDGSYGVVKGTNGVIKIEGSNKGIHIHEIRHIGQSLAAGGLKFNSEGQLQNAASSFEEGRDNEVEAYKTQYSFDGSYPAGAKSLNDINSTTLMNIKTADGDIAYKDLDR